ncbi:MAG: hypothetical protein WC516_08680 [Patescibacteria group bacterium]|jgi:hypothetical protein
MSKRGVGPITKQIRKECNHNWTKLDRSRMDICIKCGLRRHSKR